MKIIISDYDGTISDEKAKIIPENAKTIRRFQDAGNLFIVNTSRGIREASICFDVKADGYIFALGSYISVKDISIKKTIDKDEAKKVVDYIMSLDNSCKIAIYGEDKTYYRCEEECKEMAGWIKNDDTCTDTPFYEGIFSISVFTGDEEKAEEYAQYIDSNYDVYAIRNGEYFDVCCGTTKVSACNEIKRLFPDVKLYTVGDGNNDLEMIRTFGGGFISNLKQVDGIEHIYPSLKKFIEDVMDDVL